jgi:transposase-like protein
MCFVMATIHTNSIREELARIKEEFASQTKANKVPSESAMLIKSLIILLELVFSIFLEKTTRKTSRNSNKPSSQTGKDNTSINKKGSNGKGKSEDIISADNSRTVVTDIVLPVNACYLCGESLENIHTISCERRTRIDIVFEKTVEHFDAEIKECPRCHETTKAEFPKDIHGKLQYGTGLKAFAIHLMISQMVAVNRVKKMIVAMIGKRLSEATLLDFVLRLHLSLENWEQQAKTILLLQPTMHVDETSIKVNRKNYWIHVHAGGNITLKLLHPKRGNGAIVDNDLITRYDGCIIHDCWASYLSYKQCTHGLCGSHLLRELTFIFDSNQYKWAKAMKHLLQAACRKVSKSKSKKVTKNAYKNLQKRYRTILTCGAKEMPKIPMKSKNKNGKIAKSDAHNLWDRLKKYEDAVLRFARDPNVPFTNNRAEQDLRMAKVKQKVSGCFRSEIYAKAYCRISSYLQTMANIGMNPLIAIQMALNRKIGTVTGE